MHRSILTNSDTWLIAAAILIGSSILAMLLPGSMFSGPKEVEARPASEAHHQNIGNGYGTMRRTYAPQPVAPWALPATPPPWNTATQPAAATSADHSSEQPQQSPHLTDPWLSGPRGWLDDHGIDYDMSLATYLGYNALGGDTTRHGGAAYEYNLNLTFDSKRLAGYDGGSVFANFRTQDGLEHSLDGSYGNTSHLYEPQMTSITELWYQQSLFDGKLRLKAGKVDANSDFALVADGGDFLNDFASYPATILSFPTDPDQALGALAFVNPNDRIYAGAGIYDGSLQQGIATGGLAFQSGFRSSFLIGETGAKWSLDGGRDGRLAVGAWHHSGVIDHVGDSGHDDGATGPYATFDQILWCANPGQDDDQRGIAMFAMAGYANPRVNNANYTVAGGAQWTGPIPSRPSDVLGLGPGLLNLSRAPGTTFKKHNELTVEAFYRIVFNPWFSAQPDVQYVHNPGGATSSRNALAITLQALVDF
ncbi:MAG TPA: carbohydrate porin [Tepidisphaeraceae bacterium]|nr:carbohydrate porin [Tepidisphaeraceae bacterium]